MVAAGVHIALAACAHEVARAILVRAKKRAAALHALGQVVTQIIRFVRTLWIAHHAATRELELCIIIRAIPVAAPLPAIASHVVKPVAIRRIFEQDRIGIWIIPIRSAK